MPDGFSSHGADDVPWIVYTNTGTVTVYAPSEAVALQRFMAKYPDRKVNKIVRA